MGLVVSRVGLHWGPREAGMVAARVRRAVVRLPDCQRSQPRLGRVALRNDGWGACQTIDALPPQELQFSMRVRCLG